MIKPGLTLFEFICQCTKTLSNGFSYAVYDGYKFTTVFQPIFNSELEITAYEGLARIKDFSGKLVRPEAFFSELGDGDYEEEDIFVHLCIHLHIMNFANLGTVGRSKKLFLNTPPEPFIRNAYDEPEVAERMSLLTKLGIESECLVCELQELPSENIALAEPGISVLRKAGVRIALDDYGSGACDFNRVKLVSPEIVKLDMHYVQNVHDYNDEIMEILDHCKACQIKVIAEGIETQAQLEHFRRLGVAGFQGYYLSMPKEPEQCVAEPQPFLVNEV